MKEILTDSESAKLENISRANIQTLIESVREEVDSIITSPDSKHQANQFTDLMQEFKEFNQSLNAILHSSKEEKSSPRSEGILFLSFV